MSADWWWKTGAKWIAVAVSGYGLLVWQDGYFRDENDVHAITRLIAARIVPESYWREKRIERLNAEAERAEKRLVYIRKMMRPNYRETRTTSKVGGVREPFISEYEQSHQ